MSRWQHTATESEESNSNVTTCRTQQVDENRRKTKPFGNIPCRAAAVTRQLLMLQSSANLKEHNYNKLAQNEVCRHACASFCNWAFSEVWKDGAFICVHSTIITLESFSWLIKVITHPKCGPCDGTICNVTAVVRVDNYRKLLLFMKRKYNPESRYVVWTKHVGGVVLFCVGFRVCAILVCGSVCVCVCGSMCLVTCVEIVHECVNSNRDAAAHWRNRWIYKRLRYDVVCIFD